MKLWMLLYTYLFGTNVGSDDYGNTYYTHSSNKKKRWVLYKNKIETTLVPPEWKGWLSMVFDNIPEKNITGKTKKISHDASHISECIDPSKKKSENDNLSQIGNYIRWKP